jgi:hypothetical protein
MRTPLPDILENARITTGDYASQKGDAYGAFVLWFRGRQLHILASTGEDPITEGWEHVSVSTDAKQGQHPPSWRDMIYIKDLFWDESESVLQFHPPKAEYINNYSTCLHLWKPPYPVVLPPSILVGFKDVGTLA